MEVPVRVIRCDTEGCRSYCDLGPTTGDEVVSLLVQRGWRCIHRDGKTDKHYCPIHVPQTKEENVPVSAK